MSIFDVHKAWKIFIESGCDLIDTCSVLYLMWFMPDNYIFILLERGHFYVKFTLIN